MAAGEASVQLAPDGSGKKVRTLELTILQQDGSQGVVELQVISVADPITGRPLSLLTTNDVLHAILDKLEEIRLGIEFK